MLFPRACTDIGTEENLVELDETIFCKKECDLTNDPNRGCVKVRLQQSIFPESFHRWVCTLKPSQRWQAVLPFMEAEWTI